MKTVLVVILFCLKSTAMPLKCFDAISNTYDLTTGETKGFEKDSLKLYFRKNGKNFEVTNQYNPNLWSILIKMIETEEIIQLAGPIIGGGYALYNYHKKINKLTVQYSNSLFSQRTSIMVGTIFNSCTR